MSPRAHGEHVRKVCRCRWRQWPKCPHAWYFSYKPRGGDRYRFSFDAEYQGHIDSKVEAEKKAAGIRAAIDAGTFERTSDRRAREQREAGERAERESAVPVAAAGTTLDAFAPIYITRAVKASGKVTWGNDESMLDRLREHRLADDSRLGARLLSAITEDELEVFYAGLQTAGLAASTRNQYVQVIKASFRWARRKGYIRTSPVSEESALKRTKVAQRRRRLSSEEETAFLAAAGALTRGAGPRLQAIIVAALKTGGRRGGTAGVAVGGREHGEAHPAGSGG